MAVFSQSPISGVVRWISVIALLIGLAGGGGGAPQAAAARDVCGAKIRRLAGRTTRLTYRGSQDIVADVPVLCARLGALKIGHQVQGTGANTLVVEVAPADVASAKS